MKSLVALALALGFPLAAEASPPPADAAHARVHFSIRIPPLLRLRTLHALPTMEVPVGAGAVDIPGAASLEVQSNLRSAYELRLEITDPEVESVEVEGLGERVILTRAGLSLSMRPAGNALRARQHVLGYRVRLAAGARPGPRAMPVAYSLHSGI